MQDIGIDQIGVTQVGGLKPKQNINIGGVMWNLQRAARTSLALFPYQNVEWGRGGCNPVPSRDYYSVWLTGVIHPATNNLERPVTVLAIGFHPNEIISSKSTITVNDLFQMHIYTCDEGQGFAAFVDEFLATADSERTRETVSPMPPDKKAKGKSETKAEVTPNETE